MGDTWRAVSIMHASDEADEPPSYISASAACKSDPDGARALAKSHSSTVGALETFYCMGYKIDFEDRGRYKGRGRATSFET
eukprot:6166419-Pyramimonas_sp.AAC.1